MVWKSFFRCERKINLWYFKFWRVNTDIYRNGISEIFHFNFFSLVVVKVKSQDWSIDILCWIVPYIRICFRTQNLQKKWNELFNVVIKAKNVETLWLPLTNLWIDEWSIFRQYRIHCRHLKGSGRCVKISIVHITDCQPFSYHSKKLGLKNDWWLPWNAILYDSLVHNFRYIKYFRCQSTNLQFILVVTYIANNRVYILMILKYFV